MKEIDQRDVTKDQQRGGISEWKPEHVKNDKLNTILKNSPKHEPQCYNTRHLTPNEHTVAV